MVTGRIPIPEAGEGISLAELHRNILKWLSFATTLGVNELEYSYNKNSKYVDRQAAISRAEPLSEQKKWQGLSRNAWSKAKAKRRWLLRNKGRWIV
jgi:hypothetical protein